MTVADLLQAARSAGITIATAESCTGGMLAAALTDIAGSSDVFDRGFVTYSNAAKIAMLGVSPATLAQFGAVSEPTAVEMAEGALTHSTAHIAIAITGIAGPGASDHKPEGRVCFAVAQRSHPTHSETLEFGHQGRTMVRAAARDHALNLLAKALA